MDSSEVHMKFTQLQNQEQTVLPTIGSGNLHAVKKILYVSCDYFFFFLQSKLQIQNC